MYSYTLQICLGGKIPDKYKQSKPDVDLSKFTIQTVGRGSTLQVDTLVDAPGYILQLVNLNSVFSYSRKIVTRVAFFRRWQFWTEGQDIGFGVFRRTSDSRQKKGEMEELLKSERVNCHIIPEDGTMTCDAAGTCEKIKDMSGLRKYVFPNPSSNPLLPTNSHTHSPQVASKCPFNSHFSPKSEALFQAILTTLIKTSFDFFWEFIHSIFSRPQLRSVVLKIRLDFHHPNQI